MANRIFARFSRVEKSEVLPDEILTLEKRIDLIRQVSNSTHKKVQGCLQSQGTDIEKRLKKLPQASLSHCMIEAANLLGNSDDCLMGSLFQMCGDVQFALARQLLEHEVRVENDVLHPLNTVLETDIPHIKKTRSHLNKLTLDMDSAKGRHHSATKQAGGNVSDAKLETIQTDMEEAQRRVDQCKDQYSYEVLQFIAKEADHSALLVKLIESQAEYHRKALQLLEQLAPKLSEQRDNHSQMPVFGCPLEDHLKRTERDIAVVLEECVTMLLQEGMNEEGLFRIAGGSSKVKKLKAAFDSGVIDLSDYDIHCVSGALKQYLRELPEPLLTFQYYQEWMQCAHLPVNQRLQAMWVVLDRIPKCNYDNIRYLIKFLAKLAVNSDVNKMSPSNIAIVIGPNLMWPPGDGGPSVVTTSTQSSIVEAMISRADYFFPGDIDFAPSGGGGGSAGNTPPGTLRGPSSTSNTPPGTLRSSPGNSLAVIADPSDPLNVNIPPSSVSPGRSASPSVPYVNLNMEVNQMAVPSPKTARKLAKKQAPRPPGPNVTYVDDQSTNHLNAAYTNPPADHAPADNAFPVPAERQTSASDHIADHLLVAEKPTVERPPPVATERGSVSDKPPAIAEKPDRPPSIVERPSVAPPVIPDKPVTPTATSPSPIPSSPRLERPRGPPPDRPQGPPPPKPDKPVTPPVIPEKPKSPPVVAEKPDLSEKPQLPRRPESIGKDSKVAEPAAIAAGSTTVLQSGGPTEATVQRHGSGGGTKPPRPHPPLPPRHHRGGSDRTREVNTTNDEPSPPKPPDRKSSSKSSSSPDDETTSTHL